MADAKPRNGRRVALGFGLVALAWLVAVWPPPVWWRDHWPRETALMRLRAERRYGGTAVGAARTAVPPFRPTALDEISLLLPRMVIIGEDSRFRTHHGIDPAEIADALGLERGIGLRRAVQTAWRRRARLRGASTITQQLAKNLYLSPTRNPLRKVKEAVTALRLELALSKDRILELYLNVAEWGPGVWGAAAASRAYFDASPSRLTEEQAAALAATLPHPLTSNPAHRPARTTARRDLILARYRGAEVRIPSEEELDSLPELPPITPPLIPPVVESLMGESLHVPLPIDSAPDTTRSR